jgi:hypothetical protein
VHEPCARPSGRRTQNDPIYRRWIVAALVAVPVLAGTNWLENVFQGLLGSNVLSDRWQWIARSLRGLKWILVVLIVAVLVVSWVGIGWRHRGRFASTKTHPSWRQELRLIPVPVALAFVLGLLLIGPGPLADQSEDVIRRRPTTTS